VAEAEAVIKWCASDFTSSGVLIYEQIKPYDAFGLTMQKNLQTRGCPLQTLLKYPNLIDQVLRYAHSLLGSIAWTNDIIFKKV